mmetsp:Transcript_2964/g.7267  ORF Transcript_2964/g.7267 Transcript_2964/m.7267 type:complete len:214 (+) Transcript_2964:1059-1700(+)
MSTRRRRKRSSRDQAGWCCPAGPGCWPSATAGWGMCPGSRGRSARTCTAARCPRGPGAPWTTWTAARTSASSRAGTARSSSPRTRTSACACMTWAATGRCARTCARAASDGPSPTRASPRTSGCCCTAPSPPPCMRSPWAAAGMVWWRVWPMSQRCTTRWTSTRSVPTALACGPSAGAGTARRLWRAPTWRRRWCTTWARARRWRGCAAMTTT